jgi:O-antigen/teichoic acid export membrane protein
VSARTPSLRGGLEPAAPGAAFARALARRVLRGGVAPRAALLYGSQLGSSALNAVFLAAVARSFTKEQFDVFTLCVVSLLPSLGYVFEFGLSSAGARLLAIAEDRDRERRLLGALFAAALPVGVLFATALAASAPLVDALYRTDAGDVLLAVAPFAAAAPLHQCLEAACLSTSRAGLLATYRVSLAASNVAVAAALTALGLLTPRSAAVASLAAGASAAALAAVALRPSFRGLGETARELLAAARAYGLRMYTARLVNFGCGRLDTLLVPYLAGSASIGLYYGAQKFAQPVSSFARATAAARFRAFAGESEVSARVLAWNAATVGAAAGALAIAGPLVFVLLFGEAYRGATPFLLPFALVALFGGLVQPFNIFLAAHGRGSELRNASLIAGAVNVAGLAVAVPRWGLAGAAWLACVTALVHLLAHVGYYGRARREISALSAEERSR